MHFDEFALYSSLHCPKKIQAGWVKFLVPFGFTDSVTLTFHRAQDFSTYHEDRSAMWKAAERLRLAKLYLKKLGRKVFGTRGKKHLRLHYFGFAEALSRYCRPTPFHVHILVKVPEAARDRFNQFKDKVWQGIIAKTYGFGNRVANPFVKFIYDLCGFADYMSKFSHDEIQFIDDLPETQV